MSENGHEKCRNEMEGASEVICSISGTELNQVIYKHAQVERGESVGPASEDEVIDVEHLLPDPKHEKALEDDPLYMNAVDAEKYLTIEDFPCSDEYYTLDTDFGISNSDAAREGRQFLDGMLQEVDENQNLHLMGNLSSGCPDYLPDAGLAGKKSHLDNALHGGSCSGNLGSKYHQSLDMDGSTTEISDINTINPWTDAISDQGALFLDNMSIYELHETFRNTFGQNTSVKDKQWLKQRISFGLQNVMGLENASDILESGFSLKETGDMIFLPTIDQSEKEYRRLTNIPDNKTLIVNKAGKEKHADKDIPTGDLSDISRVGFGLLDLEVRENVLVTRKRKRKPTRRYIEELSDGKSSLCNERLEPPRTSSRDKTLHVKTHKQSYRKAPGAMPLVCAEDSPAGSGHQISHAMLARRGRPRNFFTYAEGDSKGNKRRKRHSIAFKRFYGSGISVLESQDDISDDCIQSSASDRSGARRKHHRLWTLSEVMKLVEGVSQYGVGRWTEIKRLLFASSAYRTSVDLKDKWRNLLRASGAQLHIMNEVDPRRKNVSSPIPQSVLRRVRDLSVIYPYPRERKSRIPSLAVASPDSAISNVTPISRSGRTPHK